MTGPPVSRRVAGSISVCVDSWLCVHSLSCFLVILIIKFSCPGKLACLTSVSMISKRNCIISCVWYYSQWHFLSSFLAVLFPLHLVWFWDQLPPVVILVLISFLFLTVIYLFRIAVVWLAKPSCWVYCSKERARTSSQKKVGAHVQESKLNNGTSLFLTIHHICLKNTY